MDKIQRVVVYMPQVQYRGLKSKLVKEGLSVSSWVRRVADDELGPEVKPIVIKEKKDVKKILEKIREPGKALGWCDFVSKEGRRCVKFAIVIKENGNYCEEHS